MTDRFRTEEADDSTHTKGVPVWIMPPWMERYRKLIAGTSPLKTVEVLLNDFTTTFASNRVKALEIHTVEAQVKLLDRLKKQGLLRRVSMQVRSVGFMTLPQARASAAQCVKLLLEMRKHVAALELELESLKGSKEPRPGLKRAWDYELDTLLSDLQKTGTGKGEECNAGEEDKGRLEPLRTVIQRRRLDRSRVRGSKPIARTPMVQPPQSGMGG